MLRLAIQKSGRLTESSFNLITECGVEFERYSAKLKIPAFNFPLELMVCRDDDIPGFIQQGIIDAAIIGQNVAEESGVAFTTNLKLGFARCRLSLAAPRTFKWEGPASLQGVTVATSYPNLLAKYLKNNGVEATIVTVSGSVELAPGIGASDVICDLVSSGSTLLSNGLQELEPIMQSEALLISNNQLSKEKVQILEQLQFRMSAVLNAKKTKYITLNAPNSALNGIVSLLPGLKSPTIMPLALKEWSSVHTVVQEDSFWTLIEQLVEAGAEGILILPIEKVVAAG